MYSLSQTHKDNVLINPPVEYIVDNYNYLDDIKHIQTNLKKAPQPKRE